MKGVERMNIVMMREQGQGIGPPRRDPYTMEVNRGRNCYACEGFGHMAHQCRSWGRIRVTDKRRLEYVGKSLEENHEHLNCLKEEENLEFLN